jgi:hypothetical protein
LKKALGKVLVISVVIALIVWLASVIFSFSYSEWSFFIGLGITIVLLFLNSSGGTSIANFEASESMWKIQKSDDLKINVGVVFYGSALYTVVSLIIMIVIF